MPTGHTKRDTLFELVEAAVKAPSGDQSRPWALSLDDEEIRRFADRARALSVDDPDDRELTISCGAALYNLRVASRSHGLEADVRIESGTDGAEARATVEMRPSSAPADHRLEDAIELRRTLRQGFRDERVPESLVERLVAAVAEEGAVAVVPDGTLRTEVADLVAEGDRLHFASRRWRRPLVWRTRPQREAGDPDDPTATRHLVSAFDVGARAARHDRELALSAPLLMVIATSADSSADWLGAGEGLEHMLLEAAAAGLQGSFLNQPCQIEELRGRLQELLPGHPFPQLIVRIGFLDAPPDRHDGSW